MKICKIDGCGKTNIVGWGWCSKHYMRWFRHGDPEHTERYSDPLEAIEKHSEWVGECLVWTRSVDSRGYGQINYEGSPKRTHRLVWENVNGKMPHTVWIDHKCHNKLCVNIEHLRAATPSQNNANSDGARKDSALGIKNLIPGKNGGYTVRLRKDYKYYFYGKYDTIEEAIEVRDKARRELYGEFAGRG